MAPEFVDDEIEQHLLEKIDHAIQRKVDEKNLVTRCYSLDSEFQEPLKILKKPKNPDYKGNWLIGRRENLYYLNNLLKEWQIIKKRSSFAPAEDREACVNIKKSLKKMMKELKGDESSTRGDSESSVSHHQDPIHTIFETNKEDVYRWSSRHGPRKVHGLEHKVLAMERELVIWNINAPYKAFGVVGVAGIGKTTLCQSIFYHDPVKKHFCPRIWVCLSKQPTDDEDYRKEIVVRILKCLGVEDEVIRDVVGKESDKHDEIVSNAAKESDKHDEIVSDAVKESDKHDEVVTDATKVSDKHGLRKLILLLRLQLIGKRYLIVLDDAWNDDEFFFNLTRPEEPNMKWGEELAYALPKGCGGTIISSSRSDALLKSMLGKDVSLQYLKPQTKEIIQEIFKDTVIGYDEDEREFPTDFEELKMEILKKCDGIPLAAKLLAKIGREKRPLKPLKNPPPPTSTDGGHENKQVPDGGGELLEGGVDTSAKDGELKDGLVPNFEHNDGLPPIGTNEMP